MFPPNSTTSSLSEVNPVIMAYSLEARRARRKNGSTRRRGDDQLMGIKCWSGHLMASKSRKPWVESGTVVGSKK
jgi:hypothetical protein